MTSSAPKQFLIILTLLLLLPIINVYAQEDVEKAASNDTTQAMMVDSAAIKDSIFAIINSSFATVKPMLQHSCYDCHSDQTKKPWYFSLPGINSWLEGHIKHAKHHVDFSNGFPFSGHDSQIEMLENIKDEVKDGDMPIFSYRIMHWGRMIEGAKQDSLFQWIDESIALLKPIMPEEPANTGNDEDDDD